MDASWWAPVDAYCERIGPGLWAEPLNAISNAGFLVAASLAWRAGQRAKSQAAMGLAALLGLIGIGSFTFHTLAVRWAVLADVIPIALFILAYLWLALRLYLGFGALVATLVTAAFEAASVALDAGWSRLTKLWEGDPLNGSMGYLPALAALAIVGWAAGRREPHRDRAAGKALLSVAGLFAVSIVFRSFDNRFCGFIPIGTHFVWHLLNAAVLLLLCQALARHDQAGADG